MALNKSVISVPFNGLDTKTANKLVANGSLLQLRNCVRRKTGKPEKRYGFTALATTINDGSGSITSGLRLDTINNDLTMISNDTLYSFSKPNQTWSSIGQVVSCLVDSDPIVKNNAVQANPDVYSYGGYTVTAWEDSRGGIGYSVQNDENASFVVSDGQLSSTGTRPRVAGFSNGFLIVYFDGTSAIKGRTIYTATPGAVSAEVSVAGSVSDAPIDLMVYSGTGVLAYTNSTPKLAISYINILGQLGGSTGNLAQPNPLVLSGPARTCVSITSDVNRSIIYGVYYDSATNYNINIFAVDDRFNTVTYGVVESLEYVTNITCGLTATNAVLTYYQVTNYPSALYLTKVRQNTCTFSSGSWSIGTPTGLVGAAGLASKLWAIGTDYYVNIVHESTLQSTVYTVKQDGFIVARQHPSLCAGLQRGTSGSLRAGLPTVTMDSQGRYVFAIRVKNKLLSETSAVQSSWIGLQRQALTFGSPTFNSDILGYDYHIANGCMYGYDGATVVEQGFNYYPENQSESITGSGQPVTTPGNLSYDSVNPVTYYMSVIYEWIDSQGTIHRSTPSVDINGIATTAVNQGIQIIVPTLQLTQKQNVNIVVYRTVKGGGTVFYRDVAVTNDPTTPTATIQLTQSDASLQTQEILYTVGGELANSAPKACKAVHKHKNRLWVIDSEDPLSVYYTKYGVYDESASFSDGLMLRLDPFGGNCTSFGTLDANLIIFKEQAIFFLVGDGPTAAGQQSDYTDPQLVSTDVGCTNPRSIVITPLGLMFQTAKGIYLLNRGLGVTYVGAGVEDYNGLTVSSATLIEDQNEVRFTTYTGECLVYNYYQQQWSVFDNYACNDACNYDGSYCHLTSDGKVHMEIVGQYNDNGQKYSQVLETAWLKLRNVQGFQRIYRWSLLGDFVSHCTTRIELAYNYESVYSECLYFYTQQGLGTDTFGSDSTFGSATVYGGNNSTVYQVRSKPRQQKCESIKFRITELDNISFQGGGSFSLVGLDLELGMRTGIYKLTSGKTIGP